MADFFIHYERYVNHQMHVMNRESSIQFIYQLCIAIHQFQNFPAIELVYDQTSILDKTFGGIKVDGSQQWIFGLIVQALSIILLSVSKDFSLFIH